MPTSWWTQLVDLIYVLIFEAAVYVPSSTHDRVGFVENYSRLLITLANLTFLSTFELISSLFFLGVGTARQTWEPPWNDLQTVLDCLDCLGRFRQAVRSW
jgi:hypothetical protein